MEGGVCGRLWRSEMPWQARKRQADNGRTRGGCRKLGGHRPWGGGTAWRRRCCATGRSRRSAADSAAPTRASQASRCSDGCGGQGGTSRGLGVGTRLQQAEGKGGATARGAACRLCGPASLHEASMAGGAQSMGCNAAARQWCPCLHTRRGLPSRGRLQAAGAPWRACRPALPAGACSCSCCRPRFFPSHFRILKKSPSPDEPPEKEAEAPGGDAHERDPPQALLQPSCGLLVALRRLEAGRQGDNRRQREASVARQLLQLGRAQRAAEAACRIGGSGGRVELVQRDRATTQGGQPEAPHLQAAANLHG